MNLVRLLTPSITCVFDARLFSVGICLRAEVLSELWHTVQTRGVSSAQSHSHLPCVPTLLRLLSLQVCPR